MLDEIIDIHTNLTNILRPGMNTLTLVCSSQLRQNIAEEATVLRAPTKTPAKICQPEPKSNLICYYS